MAKCDWCSELYSAHFFYSLNELFDFIHQFTEKCFYTVMIGNTMYGILCGVLQRQVCYYLKDARDLEGKIKSEEA